MILGILTGSSTAFGALYIFWMYALTKKVPPLDFIGMTPASPLYIYALLTVVLMVLTLIGRQKQLRSK